MCRVKQQNISKEAIDEINKLEPKRICFSTTHKNALVRKGDHKESYIGKFSIPFANSIYPIFYEKTNIDLYPSKFGGYWRSINDINEFKTIEEFINEVKEIVFIRDTLALSIALSTNMNENGKRTEIGDLEYLAKYHNDINAIQKLADHFIKVRNNLPFYKDVVDFCAVPASSDINLPNKVSDINLPNKVIDIIKNDSINNISRKLS